jgi:hypothetical protein
VEERPFKAALFVLAQRALARPARHDKISIVVTPLRDVIACPHCKSREIVYSCEPKCCFNHVCAECRSTFEINNEKTGRNDPDTPFDLSDPDSSDPTTGCAQCDSLRVGFLSADGDSTLLLCGNCRAVLKLAIENFVPGNF